MHRYIWIIIIAVLSYSSTANVVKSTAGLLGQCTTVNQVNSIWPLQVFAPYVDITVAKTPDLTTIALKLGIKHFKLASIVANSQNQPSWGGYIPTADKFYYDQLITLRAIAGDVIASFGGSSGPELATVILNVTSLAQVYQNIINQYKFTWLDFEIIGSALKDKASIDIRNQALVIIKRLNPGIKISYTLPVSPNGLGVDGIALVKSAANAGLSIDIFNILAMNYGSSNLPGISGMAQYAISAANIAYTQVQQSGLNFVYIGITAMIGVNDISNEIFTQTDSKVLLNYAANTAFIRGLSFWSLNRDNSINGQLFESSQIAQLDFEFAQIFKSFDGSSVGSISPALPQAAISTKTQTTTATATTKSSTTMSKTTTTTTVAPIRTSSPSPPSIINSRVFSPFVNVWNNPLNFVNRVVQASNVKYCTMAFVIDDGRGNLAFNGDVYYNPSTITTISSVLRSRGGDIIFSFGGAGGNEIAVTVNDVSTLVQKYLALIKQYSLVYLDFDIEGHNLDNKAANDRRNQAIYQLQVLIPNIRISYTLPVTPSGLLSNSLALLSSAIKYGVKVNDVNLMVMDYGPGVNGATGMGDTAISAARATYNQLQNLGMKSTNVGLTPMIGQNDVLDQYFRIEDANQLLKFAQSTSWISYIGMWSLQRDNSVQSSNLDQSSNYRQSDFAFSKIFADFV